MSQLPPSPWPSIIKVLLILGCTITFCVLGLLAGVLAAKVLAVSGDTNGEAILFTVLIPPTVGSLFGLAVGLISAWFVRWAPRPPSLSSKPSAGNPPVHP